MRYGSLTSAPASSAIIGASILRNTPGALSRVPIAAVMGSTCPLWVGVGICPAGLVVTFTAA